MISGYITLKKNVVIGCYLQFGSVQVDSCYSLVSESKLIGTCLLGS